MDPIGKVRRNSKKNDKSGRGGHLGCSQGFNFNLYKPFLSKDINSQSREQMHSELENCVRGLRQMGYKSFMTFMKIFFGLTNLKNMEK